MADNTIRISVLADADQAKREMRSVENSSDSLGNKLQTMAVGGLVFDRLKAGLPDLSLGMSGLANKVTLVAAALTSAVAAAGPIVALAGGLAVAVGAAGAGIGAFVGLVKPAFTAVATGVTAAKAAQEQYNTAVAMGDAPGAAAALQARAAALASLTPTQRLAAEATLNLSDALKAQSEAFSIPVLLAYSRGIDTLRGLLPQLVQVATPARDALIGIFDRLDAAAQTPEFHAFLEFLTGQIGPAITKIAQVAINFGAVFKNLFVAAAPVAQAALDVVVQLTGALANASAGDGLKKFFADMGPLLGSISDLVTTVAQAFGALVQAALPLAGPVLNAISALAAALRNLFQSSDFAGFVANLGGSFKQLIPVFDQLGQVVGHVLNVLSGQLKDLLPTLIPVVEQFAHVFGDVLVGISPLLPAIAELAGALVTAILPVLGALVPAIKTALIPAVQSLTQVVPQLVPGLTQTGAALVGLLPQIVQLATSVVPLLPAILQLAADFLSLANDALTPLVPLLAPVVAFIGQDPAVIEAIGAGILAIAAAVKVWAVAQAILDVALDANPFGAIVLAIGEGIAILVLLEKHLDQITAAMHTAWDYVKTATQVAWDAFANAITTKVNTVISTVKALKDGIIQAFSTAGDWLKDAGKKIISGLLDGIKDSSPLVQGALGVLTSSIPMWKGPPNTDRKLLYGAGQLIMGGLVDGLSRGEVAVMRQLRATTRNITAAFDDASATLAPSLAGFGNVTVQGPIGVVASSSGSGGNTYQIEIRVDPTADRVAIGAEIVNAITAFENAGGRR